MICVCCQFFLSRHTFVKWYNEKTTKRGHLSCVCVCVCVWLYVMCVVCVCVLCVCVCVCCVFCVYVRFKEQACEQKGNSLAITSHPSTVPDASVYNSRNRTGNGYDNEEKCNSCLCPCLWLCVCLSVCERERGG